MCKYRQGIGYCCTLYSTTVYCGCVCECTQYLLPNVEICQKTKHKSASRGTIGPRRIKIKIVQILHVWCVVCVCVYVWVWVYVCECVQIWDGRLCVIVL